MTQPLPGPTWFLFPFPYQVNSYSIPITCNLTCQCVQPLSEMHSKMQHHIYRPHRALKLLLPVSAHMLSHADMHTHDIPTPCASPTHCMHFLATSHHKYPYAQEQFLLPSGNIQDLILAHPDRLPLELCLPYSPGTKKMHFTGRVIPNNSTVMTRAIMMSSMTTFPLPTTAGGILQKLSCVALKI